MASRQRPSIIPRIRTRQFVLGPHCRLQIRRAGNPVQDRTRKQFGFDLGNRKIGNVPAKDSFRLSGASPHASPDLAPAPASPWAVDVFSKQHGLWNSSPPPCGLLNSVKWHASSQRSTLTHHDAAWACVVRPRSRGGIGWLPGRQDAACDCACVLQWKLWNTPSCSPEHYTDAGVRDLLQVAVPARAAPH